MTKAERRGLVRLSDLIDDLVVDLRYATPRNFLGRPLYDANEAYLLKGAALRLAAAASRARELGLRLLILDAYRPLSAQALMWRLLPDEDFVAPIHRGSSHNRGAAVDLGLAGPDGSPLPMPSDFDDFSERASQAFAGGDPEARANRELLRGIMEGAGFASYAKEWWHYVDPELRGSPLIDEPLSTLGDEDPESTR